MLIVENTAAVIVFVLWVAGFALGYLLRNWTDAARAEFENTFTYREGRVNHGRR